MTARFELETVLPVPPEVAFDLARDIGGHLDSMRASQERVVGGRRSGLIGEGEWVAWRARHFRIPFTLASRITVFERPELFVDEEIAGPFRALRHEHHFAPHPSGTAMRDVVSFEAPFGALGRLAERIVLERYLRELITARNAHLLSVARSVASDRTAAGERSAPEPAE